MPKVNYRRCTIPSPDHRIRVVLLAVFLLLLWSQQNTGSIRGQVRYDSPPEHVRAYLIGQNGTSRQIDLGKSLKEHVEDQIKFQISDHEAGTYVLYIQPFNSRGSVTEVMVKSGEETSLGQIYSACDDPSLRPVMKLRHHRSSLRCP